MVEIVEQNGKYVVQKSLCITHTNTHTQKCLILLKTKQTFLVIQNQ